MHKRKRHAKRRWQTTAHQQSSKSRFREIEPTVFAAHISLAEQEVIPIIKKIGLGPAAAVFLMGQYTQAFATGSPRITSESAQSVTLSILTLWQDGFYKPGSKYPYTLEETFQDI